MTAPKPDLATAAKALLALVERMQDEGLRYRDPTTANLVDPINCILALLNGPEQRAAQAALKAALAETQPELRVRVSGLAPPDTHAPDCAAVLEFGGSCDCGLVPR